MNSYGMKDLNIKTFFSLLGVSYYLTKEELASLIECLFEMVPEGSSIVFDYPDENLFTEKGLSNRVENMVKWRGRRRTDEVMLFLSRNGSIVREVGFTYL